MQCRLRIITEIFRHDQELFEHHVSHFFLMKFASSEISKDKNERAQKASLFIT